jgi:peptide/nickel transport system substrate-binding protein
VTVSQPIRNRLRRMLAPLAALALLVTAAGIPAASAHRALAPHAGGNLNFNLCVVLDCADAARSGELSSLYVSAAMADTLLTQDQRGKFVGDLATHWKFSHGGKWLTFFLRPGMRFSNGDPLTAKAIQFNLQRKENAPVLGPVKTVTVVNPTELIIKLSTSFRPVLSNLAFLVPIYDPSSITKNDCQSVISSGPFKISKVGPGFSSITMVRNPNHTWNVSYGQNKGPAYLNSLTFQAVTDPATTVSELISGTLDIAAVAGTQLSRVQNNQNIKLSRELQQNITWLGFNTSHPPFNDPAVRKAIAEAVSRDAVIKAALNGQGKPAYSMVPSSVPFSDPAAKSYAPPYNPADAKAVLAAHHVTGPYTLLGFTGFYATISEVIQAELAQVGVTVNVVNKPLADYFPVASKGDFDLNVLSYSGTDPDILYTLFHSSQETATGTNYTFYKNATLDKLIVQGRESTKKKAAAKAYDAAQRLIGTNVIADPLYVPYGTVGVRSRVGGFHRNVWALAPLFQDLYIK